MVEATVERNGATSTARRFFLSSLPLDGRLLARAVRAHWGIENRLHWVLDVVFHDDLMRLRTDNGPRNMSTIKHVAMNLIRAAPGKDSLKVRRKAAGQTRTTFGASSPGPLADLQAIPLLANPADLDSQAPALIRRSVQELRRVATRLAQRRIRPAYVIAWSLWPRAHQASAKRSYLKHQAKTQLQC